MIDQTALGQFLSTSYTLLRRDELDERNHCNLLALLLY
jgi:hypothetical protein